MKIIHLPQPVAATMNMNRELIKLHRSVNKEGNHDRAIEKHKTMYKNFMDELLGRNEEASEDAIAA
jgi:hypothetical protein